MRREDKEERRGRKQKKSKESEGKAESKKDKEKTKEEKARKGQKRTGRKERKEKKREERKTRKKEKKEKNRKLAGEPSPGAEASESLLRKKPSPTSYLSHSSRPSLGAQGVSLSAGGVVLPLGPSKPSRSSPRWIATFCLCTSELGKLLIWKE